MNPTHLKRLVFGLSAGLAASPIAAEPITFDLRTSEDIYQGDQTLEELDGASTMRLILSGLTADFTATVAGVSEGVFNRTGSGFGINAPNNNGTSDDDETDQLDAIEGLESISISFSSAVKLLSVELSSFVGDDRVSLESGAVSDVFDDNDGGTQDVFTPSFANTFISSFTIGFVPNNDGASSELGNGFSFDAFTVEAIPEPTVFALSLVGGGLLLRRSAGRDVQTA